MNKTPEQNQNLDPNSAHVNISGYRFVPLKDLIGLRDRLRDQLRTIGVKGTILLAEEGINIALAGTPTQIAQARAVFNEIPECRDIWLKESHSRILAFSKMKVRIRPEIITFEPGTTFSEEDRQSAPAIPPAQVERWLDEGHDFTLLDTRNRYEVASGTFEQAIDLEIDHFRNFTTAVDQALENGTLSVEKPVVTFCTGGIRCEKAAPFMKQRGFKEVYQIEGGILNYFEQCHGKHWQGDCFVFDDRVEIDIALAPTDAYICRRCHQAFDSGDTCVCAEGPLMDPHMAR